MDRGMDNQHDKPEAPRDAKPEAHSDIEQLTRWMGEYGKPALIGLALAVVILLGVTIWRNQQTEKRQAAVQALFQARAPEEFQQMAFADPQAPTAPLALATAAAEFYAQGRYDEALSAYQRFISQYPGHGLLEDAEVGVAASLEALDDFSTAAERYQAFAAARPDSPLMPQAVMGAARCLKQLGRLDEARVLYEDFIAAQPDNAWIPQAESGLLLVRKAERARDAQPLPVIAVEPEAAPAESEADVAVSDEEPVEPESPAEDVPEEEPEPQSSPDAEEDADGD